MIRMLATSMFLGAAAVIKIIWRDGLGACRRLCRAGRIPIRERAYSKDTPAGGIEDAVSPDEPRHIRRLRGIATCIRNEIVTLGIEFLKVLSSKVSLPNHVAFLDDIIAEAKVACLVLSVQRFSPMITVYVRNSPTGSCPAQLEKSPTKLDQVLKGGPPFP